MCSMLRSWVAVVLVAAGIGAVPADITDGGGMLSLRGRAG
jgi:hypothetical protein